MTAESDIGRKVRQIRHARGKSLAVIAGLAGISAPYLSMIERGERALDRRSLITALANALEVAPSDLTALPMPTPGDGEADSAVTEVRLALLAVSMNEPRGEVQPVELLTSRVRAMLDTKQQCRYNDMAAALPALIRDLHTTLDARQTERDVLRLLTMAHTQGTQSWLSTVGAPTDLSWQAAMLARQAAERLVEPVPLAVSAYGAALGLLSAGAFDLASRTLGTIEPQRTTVEDMQLAGSMALASSLISAARKDQAAKSAALEHAAELAERTGEGNAYWLGFGPSNVGVWQMLASFEASEYDKAASIAESVTPDRLVRARQAVYWREYGRALAHLPKRRDEAVLMLRRAEKISPERVRRHALTRSTVADLLARAKRDAVGRELRGMAYRAGLPV